MLSTFGCDRASPPPPPPPKPMVEVLRDQSRTTRAFEWVRSLCDDVGARMSGSPGDARAVAWAQAKMSELGLSNVRAERVIVPTWRRNAESARIVQPTEQALAVTALGGSVATPEGGLDAEVVMVPDLAALDKLAIEAVRGKIVFIDTETKATKDGSGYGAAVPARRDGPVAAAKLGASAVVIRSIATSGARLPHTGAVDYKPEIPAIPAAALSVPDAAMLHRLVDRGKVTMHLELGCRREADVASANVVGEVIGRELPDQIVVVGAHLDSWDLGTGAQDDGAGVAIALEVGRMIQAMPVHPRRTIRVVLFANEENGVRGGLEYARLHEPELSHHFAATELDLGAGKVWGVTYLTAPGNDEPMQQLLSPMRPLGVQSIKEATWSGADISPLRYRGVPVFELAQDATHYFDVHHSADDTLDKIDPKALDQAVRAAAVLVYGVADLDRDLGRVPDDKRGNKWW